MTCYKYIAEKNFYSTARDITTRTRLLCWKNMLHPSLGPVYQSKSEPHEFRKETKQADYSMDQKIDGEQ